MFILMGFFYVRFRFLRLFFILATIWSQTVIFFKHLTLLYFSMLSHLSSCLATFIIKHIPLNNERTEQLKNRLDHEGQYIYLFSNKYSNYIWDITIYLHNVHIKYKMINNVISSPELKAQVSFSDHLSSVVCPSVRLSVCLSVRL